MLTELEGDLRRDGVALVVAGDVGRVRDVERRAAREAGPPADRYPTVADAVTALAPPR